MRRVRNPAYAGWRKEAPEFHFERAEALLVAANEWGGPLALLYAQLARQELGMLRDPRFVRPGLRHPRYDVRIASSAALAFVPADDETVTAVRRAALSDRDGGVRRAALWAYGAAGCPEPEGLAREMLADEPNPLARDLAQRVRDGVESWWAL